MSEETNKLIEESIEELYNFFMEKPLRVLAIFNDFFGESLVDMQGYMDLERFKTWIQITPISEYIITRDMTGMSSNEWDMYSTMSISELPESQVTKIINNLQNIREQIGNKKFIHIFILVHFPNVRVTNENDRYVDIDNLWAKVKVHYNGTLIGSFGLNRSEYTLLHFSSNYMHSHVSYIPTSNFTEFQTPCTGSGPINGTITALNRDYDEDIWNMFCLELSKYVTVESIAGRPYHYLEKLGTSYMETEIDTFRVPCYLPSSAVALPPDKLKLFIKYFIGTKKLKFSYVNGSYSIGMSLIEYIILISNEFISWYNDLFSKGEVNDTCDYLLTHGFLKKGIIDNGKIYYKLTRTCENIYSRYIGNKVCMFKGKEITISISDITVPENENISTLLNIKVALHILSSILKVLNYRYGRETDNTVGTKVGYL